MVTKTNPTNPSSVEPLTLEQVCEGIWDCPHSTPRWTDDGVLVLRSHNIRNGRLNLSRVSFTDSAHFRQRTARAKPQPGDIVITREAPMGEVCMLPEGLRCCLGQRMVLLRPDCRRAIGGFLLYALQSRHAQTQILWNEGTGSTVSNLRIPVLKALRILLPPLAQQRSIARILGALDDKIELNRKMNQTLETLARAIFKSWFVDFEPVKARAEGRQSFGMDADTAALFPDSFVDSELGRIPKGWGVTTLARQFPQSRDCVITGPFGSNLHASDYRDQGTPLVLVQNVIGGRFVAAGMPMVGAHKFPEMDRYRLAEGDIVFTRVGAVGRSAYVHRRQAGWLISGQMLRVRVPDRRVLNPRHLSQLYQEPSFVGTVESHALGTTRPSLNTQILSAFTYICPPVGLQDRFAGIVRPMDVRIQLNCEESRILAAIRDTLLPKLMSGEVKVKHSPAN